MNIFKRNENYSLVIKRPTQDELEKVEKGYVENKFITKGQEIIVHYDVDLIKIELWRNQSFLSIYIPSWVLMSMVKSEVDNGIFKRIKIWIQKIFLSIRFLPIAISKKRLTARLKKSSSMMR